MVFYLLFQIASNFLIMIAEGGFLADIVSTANEVTNEVEDAVDNVVDKTKETAKEVETAWDNAENVAENNLENFNKKFENNEETSVDDKDVIFKYYNKDNKEGVAFNIQEFDDSKLPGWRTEAQLKIITHGWQSSDKADSIGFIRDAYMEKYDYNLITTDWSGPAKDDVFIESALKVNGVGKIIARLINDLVKKSFTSWENVHLIAHGLGGQVMGVAGANTEQLVDRISALDPSTLIFNDMDLPDDRALDWGDAAYVDIIHTAGGELQGSDFSIGDVDFYPNGGTHPQPGCGETDRKCSNGRAYEFFAESIRSPDAFIGKACENWVLFVYGACESNESAIMGDQTSVTEMKVYYLATKDKPPYGNENAE